MKQVTITTGKATIVVVDLPVNSSRINVIEGCFGNEYNDQIVYNVDVYTPNQKLSHIEQVDLPKGKWKHVSHPSQLTEEDWKGIVDDVLIGGVVGTMGAGGYWAYAAYDKSNLDGYETATESGLSLLKANGVVMENDFGEEPVLSDYIFEEHPELVGNPKEYDYEKFESDYKEWEEAQSKVWLNPQIFIKI